MINIIRHKIELINVSFDEASRACYNLLRMTISSSEHSVAFGHVVSDRLSSVFQFSKLAPLTVFNKLFLICSVFTACFVFLCKDRREMLCPRGELDKGARSVQKAKGWPIRFSKTKVKYKFIINLHEKTSNYMGWPLILTRAISVLEWECPCQCQSKSCTRIIETQALERLFLFFFFVLILLLFFSVTQIAK